ncbi:acyl-CoA thioesterase [Thermaerobacter litoralis]
MPVTRWTLRLRVRYGETDRMGRAYYARYFDWFTDGRTELIRRLGLSYRRLEDEGVFLPVLEAGCRYLRPVDYDDELELDVALTRLTPTRMDFAYRLRAAGSNRVVAEGETRHAFIDRRGKPINLRKAHPAIWEQLEALQPPAADPPAPGDEPAGEAAGR